MISKTKLLSIAMASLVVCAPFSAHAESVDLRVTGKITPPSCTPVLSGGGIVDYGTMSAEILKWYGPTKLAEKKVPFTINCSNPTKVKLQATDNRANSMIEGLMFGTQPWLAGGDNAYNFGLGTSNGKNIGGYVFTLGGDNVTLDGKKGFQVMSADEGKTWGKSPYKYEVSKTKSYSWSDSVGGAPTAFKVLSGNIAVTAVIDNAEKLDLKQEVTLDGYATLTMTYL